MISLQYLCDITPHPYIKKNKINIIKEEKIIYNNFRKEKEKKMISTIITATFDVAEAVMTGLASLLGSVIEILFDGTDLTDFGVLVILVAAVPLAFSILNYTVGLFKQSAKVKGK